MRRLSKSNLPVFRQCPKRLWLEIHKLELRGDSGTTREGLKGGNGVEAIARQIYDPRGKGVLIDVNTGSIDEALDRSDALLAAHQPIFQAVFSAEGAISLASLRGEREGT